MRNSTAYVPLAQLAATVALAANISPKGNTLPILSNVRLREVDDGVMVTATDMYMQLDSLIPGALADRGFDVTVPAHITKDMLKRANGEAVNLSVATDGEAPPMVIDFDGSGRASLNTLPSADFPSLDFDGAINADFTIGCDELLNALATVDFAISTEETRYYLNGVYMHIAPTDGRDELKFVATDGHRLAITGLPVPAGALGLRTISKRSDGVAENGVILPRATTSFLHKLLKPVYAGRGKARARVSPMTCRIVVNCTKVRVIVGDVMLTSKLIDGTFPDYGRAIPTGNDKRLTLSRRVLADMLARVVSVRGRKNGSVKLAIGEVETLASCFDPDTGASQERIASEFEALDGGRSLDIGFNASYLLDVLSTIRSDDVVIRLADPNSPALFSATDGGPLFVLMPTRV